MNSNHFQYVKQAVLMIMYLHHNLTEGNKDVCKNDKRNTNEKACDTNIETETDNDNKDYAQSYDNRCICLLRTLPLGALQHSQIVKWYPCLISYPFLSCINCVNSSTRRLYTKHQTDLILENVFQNLDFCSDPKIGNEVSNVIFTH